MLPLCFSRALLKRVGSDSDIGHRTAVPFPYGERFLLFLKIRS